MSIDSASDVCAFRLLIDMTLAATIQVSRIGLNIDSLKFVRIWQLRKMGLKTSIPDASQVELA